MKKDILDKALEEKRAREESQELARKQAVSTIMCKVPRTLKDRVFELATQRNTTISMLVILGLELLIKESKK